MTRRPSTFRKADVTRAAKAVQAAGLEVALVEVSRDGLIRVVPRDPGCSNPHDQPHNDPHGGYSVPVSDLDRELAEFDAQHDED